jgi:fructokinase
MTTHKPSITVFGEVLFDCFPNGKQVLGGAPFNVAWHLQALGDNPTFISRIGDDALGETIIKSAQAWGLSTDNIQLDQAHPTGRVDITVHDDEPHYDITPGSAYDFISAQSVQLTKRSGLLYHGSLALRSPYAQQQFKTLRESGDWSVFLDVNLRAPWWDQASLFDWIQSARWVKLNVDELRELGFQEPVLEVAMRNFQTQFELEQVIVTRGSEGASVLTPEGFFSQTPGEIPEFVDTVGAGDAFTAVFIHGLIESWPIQDTLVAAQAFASQVIGLRGATPDNRAFYKTILEMHA